MININPLHFVQSLFGGGHVSPGKGSTPAPNKHPLQVISPHPQQLSVQKPPPQTPIQVAHPSAQPQIPIGHAVFQNPTFNPIQQDQDSAPPPHATIAPTAVAPTSPQTVGGFNQQNSNGQAYDLSYLANPKAAQDAIAANVFYNKVINQTPAQVKASLDQDNWESRWNSQTPSNAPIPYIKPGSRVYFPSPHDIQQQSLLDKIRRFL